MHESRFKIQVYFVLFRRHGLLNTKTLAIFQYSRLASGILIVLWDSMCSSLGYSGKMMCISIRTF